MRVFSSALPLPVRFTTWLQARSINAQPAADAQVEALGELDDRLASLVDDLYRGGVFRRCITQPFDVPGELDVSSNKPFLEQVRALALSSPSPPPPGRRRASAGCSPRTFTRRFPPINPPKHPPEGDGRW